MRHFKLELQLDGKHAVITVNYLDHHDFVDGYVCYEVACGERRSKILVHEEYYSPPLINTPEEAIAYFELINYPGKPTAYSEDDQFTPPEIIAIGKAIGKLIYEFKAAFYNIFR